MCVWCVCVVCVCVCVCLSVGSGGNNHAVEHYAVAKYPLAVKLGTITADGGDVFSYDEDDMVLDPHLGQHLAHWGINIASMTKVGGASGCGCGLGMWVMVEPVHEVSVPTPRLMQP